MKRTCMAVVVTIVLAVLVVPLTAVPASASGMSTAEFLDREFFKPRQSPISGAMVVNGWRWYGIDVLPQLVILAAETSLGHPRLGGQLVWENNFGCMRYHGADTRWGELSHGRVWVAGKDWYRFPSADVGMMAFGRYLKVGRDGHYLKVLSGPPYDWRGFAAVYYGRNVPGYEAYVSRLQGFEADYRARAAAAGFVW